MPHKKIAQIASKGAKNTDKIFILFTNRFQIIYSRRAEAASLFIAKYIIDFLKKKKIDFHLSRWVVKVVQERKAAA